MKKYISADLRVIALHANDIVTASPTATYNSLGDEDVEYTAGRRGWDEF